MSAIAPARRLAPPPRPPEVAIEQTPRRRVRIVAVAPSGSSAGRLPFLILIAGLLVTGLVGVLLLHMMAAQDAFRVSAQQRTLAALTDQEQQVAQQVAADSAPATLRARARRLGMVSSQVTRFRQLKNGRTVAVQTPVAAPPVTPSSSTASSTSTSSAPAAHHARGHARTSTPAHAARHGHAAGSDAAGGTAGAGGRPPDPARSAATHGRHRGTHGASG
ncbi:MAG TPA: hypothetical protein VMH41_06010 [Mycobacteriales bacterium]|nr:hypothetical protein [Mycobacteriales bacterium]